MAHYNDSDFLSFLILIDPVWFRLFFWKGDLSEGASWEQLLMFCDESDQVLLATGRKLSKTIHLEATVIQDGILNEPKTKNSMDEAMFTTPGDAQMMPFVDRVFGRLEREPMFRLMLAKRPQRGENINAVFSTHLTYYFRIEGLSGKDTNMAGIRAKYVRGDEQAFGNWVNHNSRIQTALPDAKIMYAGVPNGVRTTPFYALDQTALGKTWSRHKYPTFINPIYRNEKEKQRLLAAYGGVESQGFQTQVMGNWGAEVRSSFPPEAIAVHSLPFTYKKINSKMLGDLNELNDGRIALMLSAGTIRCKQFAIGWDYGFSPDPSIVSVAVQQTDDDDWKVVLVAEMRRVPSPAQKLIVEFIVRNIFDGKFVGLSCDNVEAVQDMQALFPKTPERFIIADPGGATQTPVIMRDETSGLYEIVDGEQAADPKMVSIPNKELYTTRLRTWMINARNSLPGRKFWLPGISAFVEELIATTETKRNRYTVYYPPVDPDNPKARLDHFSDSARYTVKALLTGLLLDEEGDDESDLLAALGWAGSSTGWQAPW